MATTEDLLGDVITQVDDVKVETKQLTLRIEASEELFRSQGGKFDEEIAAAIRRVNSLREQVEEIKAAAMAAEAKRQEEEAKLLTAVASKEAAGGGREGSKAAAATASCAEGGGGKARSRCRRVGGSP